MTEFNKCVLDAQVWNTYFWFWSWEEYVEKIMSDASVALAVDKCKKQLNKSPHFIPPEHPHAVGTEYLWREQIVRKYVGRSIAPDQSDIASHL
jgi:hypothetical protein